MKQLKTKSYGILIFSDYKKTSFKILYGVLIGILILTLLITIFPPLWLLLSSFKSASELYELPFSLFPKNLNLGKVKDVWSSLQFGNYYMNSIYVILGALVCSILFNGLLAYAVSVLKPKGYKLVYNMVLISLMIPAILNMGPLLNNIVNIGLSNSYLPLWLVYGANPFNFIMFKTFFDKLPSSLFDSAQIDGCNKIQLFYKIILPLSTPIIMVIGIFTINAAWSDFLLPFLVLNIDAKQTVMVKIYSLYSVMGTSMNFGPDKLLMVLALSVIPPVIFFLIFQKQITSSVATSGMKD
ncbi:MAG: binding-protein-dependent transport system inner rane component [Haloplasmataceae bacterium]|jgi:multiple sugar transport system permease protein|nr:binding-protein-dependent transport system inner rane component [Haloplasmataceae bacterium]